MYYVVRGHSAVMSVLWVSSQVNSLALLVWYTVVRIVCQGSNFTKALKAIAVVQFFFAIEWGKFKLKNALQQKSLELL
jgi:Na+/H+ antiporter NhaC